MMSGFCDECGTSFFRPTSKWYSECGTSKHEELMEENVMPLKVLEGGKDLNVDGEEEALKLLVWTLSNQPAVTLQRRVYGKRPSRLPKEIA
jgi:hypothetical protein